jgi:hypothetical protein
MKAETYRRLSADARDMIWFALGLYVGTGNLWAMAQFAFFFILAIALQEKASRLERGNSDRG